MLVVNLLLSSFRKKKIIFADTAHLLSMYRG